MAKVQHTCTGCVPIDSSIIEAYIALLGATANANSAAAAANAAGIDQVEALVDPYTGIPSVDVSLENKKLTLFFHNLKGDGGPIGDSNVFVATYGTTTLAEVAAAIAAGKVVLCNYEGVMLPLVEYNAGPNDSIISVNFQHLVVDPADTDSTIGVGTLVLNTQGWEDLGFSIATNEVEIFDTGAPYEDMRAAVNDGKVVIYRQAGQYFPLVSSAGNHLIFAAIKNYNGVPSAVFYTIDNNDEWSTVSMDLAKVSDIPDVSSFITASVNNLVNYYLKSETYSRSEVQQLIAAIQGVSFVSVASLPTPSADTMGGKIYLVPSTNPDEQNVKDEFITIQDGSTYAWEQIGSTKVNLSGYVTIQQLNTALAAYTTTEALTTLLAAKQDTISDLSTIRSGAAAGATAYQKPQTGIPASDLAEGVIPTVPTDIVKYSSQSLTDAQQTQARTNIGAAAAAALTALETAIAAKYTKPSSGIPETDLAANVQSALALARTSIQSLADYYDKTQIDSLLAAVSSEQYVDVATLPTAGADTLGKIYLVGPTNGVYDRYYTSYDGTTYSWVGVGTTEINLANYATKAELNQLSQEMNALFPETVEDGFFIVDENLNVGAVIDEDGIHAKNIVEFETVE